MAHSLFYVSMSLLDISAGAEPLRQIIDVSLVRNARLGVTGALISTPHYFAQVLEGPSAALDELINSIGADKRHKEMKILRICQEKRRFGGWSMAYSGGASFVDRQISPLYAKLAAAEQDLQCLRVIQMMESFTGLPQGV